MNESSRVEKRLKDIKRRTRRKFGSEEKIRIVLEGLKGENSIADLCRREGIHANQYYTWSKEFLEAGKRRLSGDNDSVRVPFPSTFETCTSPPCVQGQRRFCSGCCRTRHTARVCP